VRGFDDVDDSEVCGLRPTQWLRMFNYTFNRNEYGFEFIAWPNGKCLLDQEEVTLQCFEVIKEELRSVQQG